MNSACGENAQPSVAYQYQYANGLLDQVTDAEGNAYTFTYTSDDRADKIIYPNGEAILLTYGREDNTTKVKKVTSLDTMDVLYTESATIDPETGYVTKSVDELGLVTEHRYDNGELVYQKTPCSYQTLESRPVTIHGKNVDRKQVVWKNYDDVQEYTYNGNGNLTHSIETYLYHDGTKDIIEEATYEYADPYNPNLETHAVVKADNGTVTVRDETTSYTETGKIQTVVNHLENITEKHDYGEDREEDGAETETVSEIMGTDPEDASKELSSQKVTYDEDGNIMSDSTEDSTATLTYTGKGSQTKTCDLVYVEQETCDTDANTTYVKYTNGKGQIIREKKNGLYLDYTYDNKGNQTVLALCGQEVKKEGPARVTLTLYDKDGNQTYTLVNPAVNPETQEFYVSEEDDSPTQVTQSEYDSKGNVVQSTDAMGNVTQYKYDDSDRIIKTIIYVIIEEVQHEILEEPIKVYNFEVEEFHTYYVGDSGVLVHNACAVKKGTTKKNPLKKLKYSSKVKRQMQTGDYHSFPKSVDAFGADGKITTIIGGDKIPRTKIEIAGRYRGKKGVFQYIIERDGVTCNHRLFVPRK